MPVALRREDGSLHTPEQIQQEWKTRIERARAAQKPHIPTWLSNLAFAAGQHWLVWDPRSTAGGRLRHIAEMDPRYKGRDLLTADRITEFRLAQLGELDAEDDRQQLLAAQESETAEESAKQLNQAVAYAWEHEWEAQQALKQARQYCVDMGTAAIRCRRDPDHGKVVDPYVPHRDGKPVTGQHDLMALEQQGTLADGATPEFQAVREGRTVWQPYTAIQILAPPGYQHESRFPWEILVDVVPRQEAIQAYGQDVASLPEDTDIASAMGLSTGQTVQDTRSQGNPSQSRLKDSLWRYTCFQRPNRQHPKGQVVVLLSGQYQVVDVQDQLDYQLPNGDWHTGVVYFHWWRLNDRFYSRAFIEPLKDPQRQINMVETFKAEIIRRGGPKVLLQKPLKENPQGLPLETVIIGDQAPPVFHPGIAPGEWMDTEKAGWVDNLSHASTLSLLRLGENPQNVDTYSQLQLLNDNESAKRTVILGEHREGIGTLEELGVWDIQQYWPDEKQILVAGDEDELSFATFKKSDVPAFYMVRVPKGAPQQRSQGAEFKKIDAVWAAALQSGWVNADPHGWTQWYVDSIDAGTAQEIPEPGTDSQTKMAEYENLLMRHGQPVIPADYDLLPTHLPIHRAAQDQARAEDNMPLFLLLQQHIDASVQVQQENAARVAGQAQTASPLATPQAGGVNPVFAVPDFQRLATGN